MKPKKKIKTIKFHGKKISLNRITYKIIKISEQTTKQNVMKTDLIRKTIDCPIVFFDLETTGVDPKIDRIVQISCIKLMTDGETITRTRLINPTVPIPPDATEIHGITDETIKSEPTFKQIAPAFYEFIKGCHLAGYNSNRFDIPLLIAEFSRAGIDFEFDSKRNKIIDIYKIYSNFHKRDLKSCYLQYTDKQLIENHNAENDALATIEIFEKMLYCHPELLNVDSEFYKIQTVDLSGHLILNKNGETCFNFGKHKGKRVIDEKNYCDWILNNDFPMETKRIIKGIIYPTVLSASK